MIKVILTDIFIVYPIIALMYLYQGPVTIVFNLLFLVATFILLCNQNKTVRAVLEMLVPKSPAHRAYVVYSTLIETVVLCYLGIWGIAALWALIGLTGLVLLDLIKKYEASK